MSGNRIHWIDSVKGFAMFLVIYSHNYPMMNNYFYSFHVPLFFFVSGIFHPNNDKTNTLNFIKKRFISIMIPYFLWAILLYVFWFLIGRHYGESERMNLSVLNNFIGIWTGQGGQSFMDWGIPIWFLPCVFSMFVIYGLIKIINNKILEVILIAICAPLGYYMSYFFEWYIWSIDVALVGIVFYALGNYFKKLDISYVLLILFGLIHILLHFYNGKVDMYRSNYGNNIFLFYINAVTACFFYLQLFKKLPKLKLLAYIGKHTIVFLALQMRMLTVIKLFMMVFLGITVFKFTELEKLGISVIQVLLLLPVAYLINKYLPILDGKKKKL
ncbi:acyltransferase family protein [uncultured Aquimarina sp.]|uniref:acyltransferase family protein n=1 Tax=uncultured Aquimarina sp. TaxID=575652 RepID=UPI002606BBC8|nr:acyltransferase family protein [uncultured Aquimarina sp.]